MQRQRLLQTMCCPTGQKLLNPFPCLVARKHGGRLYLLFFTAILHGLVVESLSYVLPDVDNFWHGVSSIIFFKQRLPLHIVLFCEFGGGGGGGMEGGGKRDGGRGE